MTVWDGMFKNVTSQGGLVMSVQGRINSVS